jgi:hypothetical protein
MLTGGIPDVEDYDDDNDGISDVDDDDDDGDGTKDWDEEDGNVGGDTLVLRTMAVVTVVKRVSHLIIGTTQISIKEEIHFRHQ